MTRQGPIGTPGQASAAASFFARNNTKQGHGHGQGQAPLLPLVRHNSLSSEADDKDLFKTNFRAIISKAPPVLPSNLLRRLETNETSGLGKVRVVLRVATDGPLDEEKSKYFGVDKKKRQVTLLDPSVGKGEIDIEERKVGVAAPKMFAFDGVFANDDSQEDVCGAALSDVIAAVINGNDGCLFCFGHANLGKSWTMIGDDASVRNVGVIPTAVAWLYRSIKERRAKTGARFSVRVSAMEIIGGREETRDLLARFASDCDQSPSVYLSQGSGQVMGNMSEVRASTADKAAYYLDAALSERSRDPLTGRESHFIFSLYVYQYSLDRTGKGGVVGGRSKLHLIDFGDCDRSRMSGGGITLSGLGNVILAIFNGHKHLPCRESRVTGLLRECLGGVTCHATMLAHVSPDACHYSETLHTIQLASRVHRMRRKRSNKTGSGSASTSSDEGRRMSRLKSGSSSEFTTSTDPSSSEMSCDTVVYKPNSDGSGTDGEGPPCLIPSLRSSQESLLSRSSRRRSGSRILTNGAISPAARNNSPLCLPVIDERQERMPLHGRVPGYRQREVWIDSMPPSPLTPTNVNNETKVPGYTNNNYKVDMVSQWVENQSYQEPVKQGDAGCLFLTQFKQADSDSGSDKVGKVQVHQDKKVAPPPPPRRTPPRVRDDVEGSESPEPLMDPVNIDNVTSPSRVSRSEMGDICNMELIEVETSRDVVLVDGECQVQEDDIVMNSRDPPHCHPLRILSEENLTVVSTFVADINDLESVDGDNELDPSKFSFFTVPDFTNNNDNNDNYFEARLKELAKIGDDNLNANETVTSDKKCNNETQDANKDNNDESKDTFSDPRFLYGNYREMSTFCQQSETSQVTEPKEEEPMTPQKQFLLLSQSLRHPDGSSNPDLTKRSPGNGQSSSDQEDEMINDVLDNYNDVTVANNTQNNNKTSKKNELTFAARLMRLFSSKRNKNKISTDKRSQSCDRELESSVVSKSKSKKDVRSTSASPLKSRHRKKNAKKDYKEVEQCITPVSCLSLAPTEWEYQDQVQDVVNGNVGVYQRRQQQSGDRKSSGYDSLEGESSSLDSSHDVSENCVMMMVNGNNTVKYAVPSDNTNIDNIINYDDVTALKMEIKRHPNILRQAY